MNKQQQQEFLSKPCESNEQWVAQTLLQLPAKERHMIVHALRRLDKYLYKSWAKMMSLSEIMEAVNIFSEAKPAAKEQLMYTMMDPNTQQQPDELKANEQAENAQESAAQDAAVGAGESETGAEAAEAVDAEEGGIQG